MKPQKHAEFIKAWAEGSEIEIAYPMENGTIRWVSKIEPKWYDSSEYRIKPEPKPDVVEMYKAEYSGVFRTVRFAEHWEKDNLKLTFDGETGKLKSAEVLK